MDYKFVDENLIVVSKPSGLPTTYKNIADTSDCLLGFVAQDYPDVLEVNGFKPNEGGLIYRLDNSTSGLVIIARNQKTFDELVAAQDQNRFMKYYYAICENTGFNEKYWDSFTVNGRVFNVQTCKPELEFAGTADDFKNFGWRIEKAEELGSKPFMLIDLPVGHSRKTSKRMIAVRGKGFKTKGSARNVITLFRVIDQRGKLVFVEALITKGMRHQIRVHLASVGLRIVGDRLYNATSHVKLSGERNRLYLHCGKIEIVNKSCL